MQYNKGKWHRGPDALSRNPVSALASLQYMEVFSGAHECYADHILDEQTFNGPECATAHLNSSHFQSSDVSVISLDNLREKTCQDTTLQHLTSVINRGFPTTHSVTPNSIQQYFPVRDDLWLDNGIVMFKNRLVIPLALRQQVLHSLHAAHQGVEGMRKRASVSVYWPGLNSDIRKTRTDCSTCNEIAPSQPREPLVLTPHAEYPFQHVCADYFSISGHHYLSLVDRFSGWPIIFHYPRTHPTSSMLIRNLRSVFSTYGTPELLISDEGPQFTSQELKRFLHTWKVATRVSSAGYPQSNGRAELSVKTAKRILEDNMASDGSLNTDRACRALLQYRNTPLQHSGISPSQILFHRHLRDCIPTKAVLLRPHPSWIDAANQREQAYYRRNQKLMEEYNRTVHTLPPIDVGSTILIHDGSGRRRWNRVGTVVDTNARRYTIRMHGSGRIVTRNRRFLKKTHPIPDDGMLMQTNNELTTQAPTGSHHSPASRIPLTTSQFLGPTSTTLASSSRPIPPIDQEHTTTTLSSQLSSLPNTTDHHPQATAPSPTIPNMLKCLLPHNRPGLKESFLVMQRSWFCQILLAIIIDVTVTFRYWVTQTVMIWIGLMLIAPC